MIITDKPELCSWLMFMASQVILPLVNSTVHVSRCGLVSAKLEPTSLPCVQVKGLLVMYGLPWLLTGAILAHEVMHAWVAENNINCGRSDGDEMSAVGEGLAELLGFMWLEAQVNFL